MLPKGEAHNDEYFGEQEVYRAERRRDVLGAAVGREDGRRERDLPGLRRRRPVLSAADQDSCRFRSKARRRRRAAAARRGTARYVSEQDSYAEKIKHGNIFLVLLSFFGAGLLLAFTPCVLPMVPILSGIIAGSGENVTTRRSFMLSLAYVLGMAFTYTAAGIAAGAIGQGFNLQATFNQPWIVALFSLLFVVLAASMFGLFTIEMPGFIQTRLEQHEQRAAGRHLSRRRRHGRAVGAHRLRLRRAAAHRARSPSSARPATWCAVAPRCSS